MVIRPARRDDDFERVFDLLWQLAPDDARPPHDRLAAAWQELHAQAGRRLLLAEAGEELVGTLDSLIVPNLTHAARPFMLVENVVVAVGERRRGVATALMRAAVEYARSAGCYKIQLLSNKARVEAHEFYERAGFTASALGYRHYL